MKKKYLLSFAFLIFISCNGKREVMQLNLVKGTTYYQHISSQSKVIQNINSSEMAIDMTIDGTTAFKVIDADRNTYTFSVDYASLDMSMSVAGNTMRFSSSKNDSSDILSTLLKSMIKKPFIVKMTKKGKVVEIKDIDKLFENMFELFPKLPEVQKATLRKQLSDSYGEKSLKSNIEISCAIFPEKPIRKGDKWNIKSELNTNFILNISTDYVINKVTKKDYEISGKSILKPSDKNDYVEHNGLIMKYNLKGTTTSTIKIDRKTGWTTDAYILQNLKGDINVKGNSQLPDGMNIPITITNNIILTDKK